MRRTEGAALAAAFAFLFPGSQAWTQGHRALDELKGQAGPAAASLPAAPATRAKAVPDDLEESDADMFPGLAHVLASDEATREPRPGELAGTWKLDQEFYDFSRPWGFPDARLFLSPGTGSSQPLRGTARGLLEKSEREGPFPIEFTDRAVIFTVKDGSGRHRRDYRCRILLEDGREMLCSAESEVRESGVTTRRYTAYLVFRKTKAG